MKHSTQQFQQSQRHRTVMAKQNYYKGSSFFKTIGKEFKNIVMSQDKLQDAGLRIGHLSIQTVLQVEDNMQGVKNVKNSDLFLSGPYQPSFMKIKIAVDTIVKSHKD